jgi:hypothetical protein
MRIGNLYLSRRFAGLFALLLAGLLGAALALRGTLGGQEAASAPPATVVSQRASSIAGTLLGQDALAEGAGVAGQVLYCEQYRRKKGARVCVRKQAARYLIVRARSLDGMISAQSHTNYAGFYVLQLVPGLRYQVTVGGQTATVRLSERAFRLADFHLPRRPATASSGTRP